MHFKGVTLLVTHYNRSSSLERLLFAFATLGCSFDDIVVSDDGSRPEHLEHIKRLTSHYKFRFIGTPVNKGLGNNINKGQDAVSTPFTLYVQEDFVPKPLFAEKFAYALKCMQQQSSLDMVRFYAYFRYPFLQPVENGFSEMIFSTLPWYFGYRKFYYYSDHPHLRRTSFFQKFGRYHEGIKVEKTEYKMMFAFLQNKGKALFYDEYQDLFEQKNSAEEPSTVRRNLWRESGNFLVSGLREVYRYVRFHYDLFFTPSSCRYPEETSFMFEQKFKHLDEVHLTRYELTNKLEEILLSIKEMPQQFRF
ncbi:glycosyltransferase [Desertivirga xinjiangensis]|uniref:glycosyltransferase n=1 Tax=Desertivirga xinjiangensis TaxID=539206 RepID=UPI00210D666C|nr:glycosyltransferase [Pedobacter xinjiangensis]